MDGSADGTLLQSVTCGGVFAYSFSAISSMSPMVLDEVIEDTRWARHPVPLTVSSALLTVLNLRLWVRMWMSVWWRLIVWGQWWQRRDGLKGWCVTSISAPRVGADDGTRGWHQQDIRPLPFTASSDSSFLTPPHTLHDIADDGVFKEF